MRLLTAPPRRASPVAPRWRSAFPAPGCRPMLLPSIDPRHRSQSAACTAVPPGYGFGQLTQPPALPPAVNERRSAVRQQLAADPVGWCCYWSRFVTLASHVWFVALATVACSWGQARVTIDGSGCVDGSLQPSAPHAESPIIRAPR